MPKTARAVEWPTLVMLALTYAVWIAGTMIWSWSGVLAIVLTAVAVAQFSSLQHEVLHGHPFETQWVNEALVFPALALVVPYIRFKDTHLQHHYDPNLTDPYDDPESNYLDPKVWEARSRFAQKILRLNNTLLGRMLFGPAVGTWYFVKGDTALMKAGDARVRLAWVLNAVGVAMVLVWLWTVGSMPLLAYVVSVYLGTSLLKIRTFLEHRAHEKFRARTVIIEDRGPLSYLFLNNNFHVIHHCMPNVPWYALPGLYAARREHYQRRNEAYVYRSYADIFRLYFLRAKDPVPHPVWPVRKSESPDAM
ncbi:MAG: fatty acid desaturase [Rhodobacteraceae bacterium]|nr:fatty acid desaturase [Paracoccaceae bacterium]